MGNVTLVSIVALFLILSQTFTFLLLQRSLSALPPTQIVLEKVTTSNLISHANHAEGEESLLISKLQREVELLRELSRDCVGPENELEVANNLPEVEPVKELVMEKQKKEPLTLSPDPLLARFSNPLHPVDPPVRYVDKEKKAALIVAALKNVESLPSPPTLAAPFDNLPTVFAEDKTWLFEKPDDVTEEHLWRYESKGLYWTKQDALYRKAMRHQDMQLPPSTVTEVVDSVCEVLMARGRKTLCDMFRKCFPNTLETTTFLLDDGTSYIITGDIPLMWMRDSSAQVNQYIELAPFSTDVQVIIEGTIRRQIKWIKLDPYGSSFRLELDFDHVGKTRLTDWDFKSGRTIHVAMHNYEIDSLCYFLRLSHRYWMATGIGDIFDEEWLQAAEVIVKTWQLEQNHTMSEYTYPELSHKGLGKPVCPTGMTWGGFRPSDDPCTYHYLIPSNMFAVVVLQYLEQILLEFYPTKTDFLLQVELLREEIDEGIHTYGVVTDESFGKIYAYEVDGCGAVNLMDDANVPSLLSIPYLGYTSAHDPSGEIASNTRAFILSPKNPFFFSGKVAKGIGSPHTRTDHIWHMSLIMQALTSEDRDEINDIINVLEATTADTNFMHESFHKDNPNRYSRSWFAWANSLFSELILKNIMIISSE